MERKQAIITIDSTQETDGEKETIQLKTEGSFSVKDGKYYLTYKDTEATGFVGDTTTLKVEGQKKVTLLRFGKSRTQLIISKGSRNYCSYDTGYGMMDLEIYGDRIRNNLDERGGDLFLRYTVDFERTVQVKNELSIQVKTRDVPGA